VQNAMDASKIQLFLDWEKRNPKMLARNQTVSLEEFLRTLPYDLRRVAVTVELKAKEDGSGANNIMLSVRDNGIGISMDKLKKMKYVGNIYDPEVERLIKRMPEWLKPTGAFGIGLQSVFHVKEKFRMLTYSSFTNECYRITFHSTATDGEIFPENCDKRDQHGTDIEVDLTALVEVLSPESGYYISVDSFLEDSDRVSPIIRDYLNRTVRADVIPVQFLSAADEKIQEYEIGERVPRCLFENVFKSKYNSIVKDRDVSTTFDFMLEITESGPIVWRWSNEHGILVEANIGKLLMKFDSYGWYRDQLKGKSTFDFKGICVQPATDKTSYSPWHIGRAPWCDANIHILSGDVKKILALNRERFQESSTPDDRRYLRDVIKKADSVLLEAFQYLLLWYYEKMKNEKPQILWSKLNLANHKRGILSLLLTLAADCIRKLAVQPDSFKSDGRKATLDSVLADKMSYIISNIPFLDECEIDTYIIDTISKCLIHKELSVASKIFEDIDNTWFLADFNIKESCHAEFTSDSIQVFNDMLISYPIPLYWSSVFYCINDSERIEGEGDVEIENVFTPIPVYKYCTAVYKSIQIKAADIRLLFVRSCKFGYLDKDKNTEQSESLRAFFGERHIFPAFSIFEKLAIP
jgi:hypothetical protein